jgi:membrane-associated HD superfamily phosphohydrolase
MAAKKSTKKTSGSETSTKKLTASQRIEALENIISNYDARFEAAANEIDRLQNLLQSLAKRLNASIRATESDDAVKNIIIEDNVKDLQGKVDFLIEQGALVDNPEGEVHNGSFIVGREVDASGKVVNPRIQFALGTVIPEFQQKLLGKKVGDLVNTSDDDQGGSIEILSLYNIEQPKVEKKFEDEEPV